jgi:lipopolysaccharide biosynthesis glycosyltransferase
VSDFLNVTKLLQNSVKRKVEFFNKNSPPLEKTINIGFGVDAAFIRPMGVTITSLAENNSDIFFNAYLFFSSISDDDLTKLEQIPIKYPNIKLILYEVELETFKQLPRLLHISLATYFRFIMPIVLSNLANILYLDADILCLNTIEKLTDIDLAEKVAVVIEDKCGIEQVERIDNLNLSHMPLEKYFNAGVILINIAKWNELEISENAIKLLSENPTKFKLLDQDILNILLNRRVKYLTNEWNHMLYMRDKDNSDMPSNIVLLHCTDIPKPWSCVCRHYTQNYYLHYEKLSPWQQMPLEQPKNYREAKYYAILLLKKGDILEGIKWFKTFVQWKLFKK